MYQNYKPREGHLEIIHEDSQILVVSKPAGLLSVPGRGIIYTDCLLKRVQVVFPDALLIHRLDRDTSGLMVFGLTRHAQRHLSKQFEARLVKKAYVARVLGSVTQKEGLINLPLIVDWPNRPRQKICHETGKVALTGWKLLKSEQQESRLRLFPKTGRSHQLRVHCLALGHPILGDSLYCTKNIARVDRMMLHSEELRFSHPESGKGVKFRSKVPF